MIVVNQTLAECRLAHIKAGVVEAIFVERPDNRSRVGDIHWGKVVRVLPAMGGAFVDIGDTTPAFLPKMAGHLPRLGEEVMVQITKDAHAKKPVTLTLVVRLVSRYLVYMPSKQGVSASQKITDKAADLIATVQHECQALGLMGGVIVRTNANHLTNQALRNEVAKLCDTWQALSHRPKLPTRLLAEPVLPWRFIRDYAGDDFQVVVDDKNLYQQLKTANIAAVSYHQRPVPIFEYYGAELAWQQSIDKYISLPSGGHLVVEVTEALTVIDVNAGLSSPDRTNAEAVVAIARLLRLRQIGGMVVVDLINTKQQQLALHIKNTLNDPALTTYYNQQLCLLHISLKRRHQTVQEQLCVPCPTCLGVGYQKSPTTLCYELARQLIKHKQTHPKATSISVAAHPDIIKTLQDDEMVAPLEKLLNCAVLCHAHSAYQMGQWAIS